MPNRDPTFVLIHGGASSSRFWDLLVPLLTSPAIAVDLPGRAGKPADPMTITVDDCVASLLDDLAGETLHDVVVVAHSSGGLFVPGVVAGLAPRVKHIVLSSGCVPTEGGLGLEAMKPSYARRNREAMDWAKREGRVITTPGPPADPEKLRNAYGVALDDAQLAFIAAPERNPHDSQHIYFQPVFWSAAKGVPVTVVRQLLDPVTPLELQDEMIGRLPSPELVTVVDLDTGHIPAVTHPEALAAILDRVATTVREEGST
jgi:pimeloyl-ACP methyl ester carboxylesterase